MKRVSILRYKNVYIDYWNFAVNKISYFVFYCVNNKETGQNARMQPMLFVLVFFVGTLRIYSTLHSTEMFLLAYLLKSK